MTTKTVRSRFNHEVGERVEGCTILEKHVIAPPNPIERRLGIYDYLVEVLPAPAGSSRPSRESAPARESFTRATPEEIGRQLTRRIPSR